MKQKEANMKKRALTLFLALVMVVSMAACGGTTESAPPESTAPESSAPESEAPAEPAEVVATPILDVVTETVTVDPANPLGSELAGGLYTVDLDGGRVLYHYVPETIGYRQPAVAIGVPSDSAADQFIADTGWQTVAEERGISLILMVAGEGGYAADESAYADAVYGYMDGRDYLQMQDAAYYMVGYGDAADMVMNYAVTHPHIFAGFAAFGVDEFDTAALDAAASTESPAAGVMLSQVAVPMWLGAESETASVTELVDYWKSANECSSGPYAGAYADEIYVYPEHMSNTNEITYSHCSKVLVTIGLDDVETPEFTDTLYNDFLMRTRRQDSGDINALRPFATNEEKGMDYVTLEVDGTTREFWVYVPTDVANGRYENVPVVFAFHGGGGSGEEFAARSGWDKVAEERNFIAVFPTGYRSNDGFKASTTWGDADMPFFEAMRTYMLETYPVDVTRIYVSGQSMGCVMSCTIALQRPELIAACAATSARVMPSETENVDTSLIMPFMWSVGEKDQYFVEGGKDYGMIPACIAEWRGRYGITADESNTYTYQNGDFHGYDFKNVDGVTLIREQLVTDKIHAMLPDEVYTLYDFLSAYSRGEDGTSYYMGMPISAECN